MRLDNMIGTQTNDMLHARATPQPGLMLAQVSCLLNIVSQDNLLFNIWDPLYLEMYNQPCYGSNCFTLHRRQTIHHCLDREFRNLDKPACRDSYLALYQSKGYTLLGLPSAVENKQ